MLDFPSKSYNIFSFQCCRLSLAQRRVTFCATFYLPKYIAFNLIFLLIFSIWFSYDPEQLYKVCIYSLLLVSSLLRCLSAEYLLNIIFIWMHFSFILTSGIHDRAALSTYSFLAASEFRAIQSLRKNFKYGTQYWVINPISFRPFTPK